MMGSHEDSQSMDLGAEQLAGRYRHYKGGEYEIVGLAQHTETGEECVVYRQTSCSPGAGLWVRPSRMFFETIVIDGVPQPRFVRIS